VAVIGPLLDSNLNGLAVWLALSEQQTYFY
jgi:hypothetical protein